MPSWQGVDSSPPGGAGVDRLREVLVPLQGVALAPEVWERDALPRRVGAYSQAWMDQLCAGGEIVWLGAGAIGRNSGKVALYFREDAPFLGPPPSKTERPEGPIHDAIRERLERGASFWTDLLADVAVEPVELQNALWDLAWAGEVTNDAFAPLRAPRLTLARAERERAARRFGRRRRPAAPQIQGRWSLTAPLFAGAPAYGARTRATAEILLERYGIVTRETVLAEGIPGGFAALYGEFVNLETLGTARRGYFVEGLGGAQFALGAAVERLRGLRSDEPAGPLVLAATDPANPYGAALPWPERPGEAASGHKPGRKAGALVILVEGHLVLYVERGGKTLLSWGDNDLQPAVDALALAVHEGALGKLTVERADGGAIIDSPLAAALEAAGFHPTPRGLRLRS
jgi:ATP-dependent Lhr-like helicase